MLDPLEEDHLKRILTEPRNAIVRQYQKMFRLEGAELEFEPDALAAIAQLAMERSTGVRALRSILEERMLEVIYELPSHAPGRYVVTAEFVRGEAPIEVHPLPSAPAPEIRDPDELPESRRREAS